MREDGGQAPDGAGKLPSRQPRPSFFTFRALPTSLATFSLPLRTSHGQACRPRPESREPRSGEPPMGATETGACPSLALPLFNEHISLFSN